MTDRWYLNVSLPIGLGAPVVRERMRMVLAVARVKPCHCKWTNNTSRTLGRMLTDHWSTTDHSVQCSSEYIEERTMK